MLAHRNPTMTHCENLRRTVRFEWPEWIPMTFHIIGSCWQHYPQKALQELMAGHQLADWAAFERIRVKHHPFRAEIDHLVDCIRNNRESHCNLEDAIKTHEVVFAAQECCSTGKPVSLPHD